MPNPFDLLAKKKKQALDAAAASPEGQLTAAGQRSTDVGTRVSDAYVDRTLGFDPNAAYDKAMAGAGNQFGEVLDERIERLNGASVGAGRIDTGFWDEDKGDVVRDVARDFANTASSNALNVSAQTMAHNNSIGQYGLEREQMGMDVNAGNADRAMMRENAKKEERARKRGGIGGLIGGVLGGAVGFGIGGPGGAFAGWNAGSTVGGRL